MSESKYRALMVECCEYLDRSSMESIGAGSKLHTAMKDLLAEPPVQTEPFGLVGWQFYEDGQWWFGSNRLKDHRTNTVAAGYPVRDVYAHPPAVQAIAELVEALQFVAAYPMGGTAVGRVARAALAKYKEQV